MPGSRLAILKTYKLYIGGSFPRTESGRYMIATDAKTDAHLANYCHASRKDLRDAVRAARKAFSGWSGTSAYLRGQILYRAAEMLESRRDTFIDEIRSLTGVGSRDATREVDASVDRLVYFAGWTDKIHQVFGAVNPVASSHFNFTTPEPTGVVGLFSPDQPSLLALVSEIAAIILSGNTVVAIASETAPLPAISLAEVFATSDLPSGVVNILTGQRAELAPVMASHMDVNAVIDASGSRDIAATLQSGVADNVKRFADHSCATEPDWFGSSAADPYRILDTIEHKTAWHPIGV